MSTYRGLQLQRFAPSLREGAEIIALPCLALARTGAGRDCRAQPVVVLTALHLAHAPARRC